jgi:LacI family transcriptional regulator
MAQVNSVNIRQIAEEAGVSHITVSRALRDYPSVAKATKARVLAVAQRLGYKNNPLVQAYATHIRRGKVGGAEACNLAWLASNRESLQLWPWQSAFHTGAFERAAELGYSMDDSINAHGVSDHQLDRVMQARGIRGVILPFIAYFDRDPYQRSHLATVGIGETPAQTPMHCVTPDHFKNVTAAVDRLLAYGYQRIGFCEHGFSTVMSQGAQWGSFLFNQARIPVEQHVPALVGIMSSAEDELAARDAFLRWLERHRPDAILVTFNQVGAWLADAGIRVPDEVAVAHLGLSQDVQGWSGMDYSSAEIGSAAVDLLTSHIMRNEYGIPESPKLMHITGKWVDGRTTSKPEGSIRAELPASESHPYDWFEHEFWSER